MATGPVGRQGSAATDMNFNAEIYSYARTRGLFGGIALDGSVSASDQSVEADAVKALLDAMKEAIVFEGIFLQQRISNGSANELSDIGRCVIEALGEQPRRRNGGAGVCRKRRHLARRNSTNSQDCHGSSDHEDGRAQVCEARHRITTEPEDREPLSTET